MRALTTRDPRWIGRNRRYEILAELGAGGMGKVYLGRSRTAELVAVKVIQPHLLDDDTVLSRFRAEIAHLRRAQGLRVAHYRGCELNRDNPWLAVEYVNGSTLRRYVADNGVLDGAATAALGAMLAEGLETIHSAGLLHRDLKPSNVMLGSDSPRIIDLGLAVLRERHDRLTQLGHAVGTVAFMPPEQAVGETELTEAVDVYALGATLLYASTRRHPYPQAAPLVLAGWITDPAHTPDLTGVPRALGPLLTAMLAHHPGARPGVADLITEFSRIVEAQPGGFAAVRRRLQGHTPAEPVPEALRSVAVTDETDPWPEGPTELVIAPSSLRVPGPTVRHSPPTPAKEQPMTTRGRLRVLQSAEKEILKLSRADVGAVYEFQHKFRSNPDNPGLRLKQLKGGDRLWSARVNADLRAILLHIVERDYLLVDVKHRGEVYEELDRYAYRVNRVTGALEVVDLEPVPDTVLVDVLPPEAPPLFDDHTDTVLLDLGVAEPLLPRIRSLRTEDELLELVEGAPQLTADVLLSLHDGKRVDDVRRLITEPVRVTEQVDPDDLAAALVRPATQVTSDDKALQAVLSESFESWQVFLHPTQRRLVDRATSGPTRVSGGPGTGKTIVALHRVAHLAAGLKPGDGRILLTTFSRNLAADLRNRLEVLTGGEALQNVDVINIDRLARRIATEPSADAGRTLVDDHRIIDYWRAFLGREDPGWTPEFLSAEWTQVILGQMLDSGDEYATARRPGRGRPLNRPDRAMIWELCRRFEEWTAEQAVWTHPQIAVHAARAEQARMRRPGTAARYRHIVVDEAQDLSTAHWRLLRCMAPVGPDDLFLVGDTHQRIYDNRISLSRLGVDIRGRSHRLTLNYRTTRQILATALELMSGEQYDDMNGSTDTLDGYRSLLSGGRPALRRAADWPQEMDLIRRQLEAWGDESDGSVAICVPTHELAADLAARLTTDGVDVVEVGSDGPVRAGGVHLGTMHRFKGLEYRRMIIAGIREGLVPHQRINGFRESDPTRYQRERQRYRSLLFVAATRARDDLVISWHATPSPFLTHRQVTGA
ncbi:protein kinase [Micromonospora sp. WP24]|uniref:protein kinase domain-containing protein n=1 Tax=Micromonospora sp. WP24 TaxID=2604469 RepID=UPI0016528330|nr:protein kinase [Micromonospora sp. WP24]